MTRRDLPNFITVIRILLVAPFAWALQHGEYGLALSLFVVAGTSDGIDGWLARHYGWHSTLGAVLDPLADKLLLVTAYLGLGLLGFLPMALVIAVLARDVIIVSGAVAYRLWFGHLEMAPSLISKLNTLLQVALAVVAIASRGLDWLPAWSADVLVAAVFASTVLSGAHYVVVWSARAWRESRRKTP
ncbi:MAG: CDP-alcohol phosphatidyltransferase family protein [Thiohalomonadaceae bacterium]